MGAAQGCGGARGHLVVEQPTRGCEQPPTCPTVQQGKSAMSSSGSSGAPPTRLQFLVFRRFVQSWRAVAAFDVAKVFTGSDGVQVPLEDTISSFKAVVAGEYDHLPEGAFYMVGGIDEVIAKAEKMAAEAA